MLINKIKRKILRELYKVFNYRPSSYPFISGDGFRSMADHIYDETQKLNPDKVLKKQVVFVKSDMLVDFFQNTHPKIQYKYILISHNSDENITEKYLSFIDDKIIHWFAQNLMIEHERLSVIPIGIENKYLHQHGLLDFFQNNNKQKEKKDRILFGFNIKTNPLIRNQALTELRSVSNADEILKPLDSHKYMNLLSEYKYVASPPGNGIDCIRTWEAIILGTIPICLNNKNTELFIKIGAPIVSVDSYKDAEYNVLKSIDVIKDDVCRFEFWEDIINSKK